MNSGNRPLALVAAISLLVAIASGTWLDAHRLRETGFQGDSLELLALGGFRPLAIDLLQARADLDYRSGKDFEVLADLDLLLRLQPRNDELWCFYVYHVAFNLPALEASEAGQCRWIERAVAYGKEGLKRFPTSSIVHSLFGFVCVGVVTRHPALVESFARSEGRSPLVAALEAYDRAAELRPDVLANWIWAIECRRNLALEDVRSSRFDDARARFERMGEDYRRVLSRFGGPASIVDRREADDAAAWIEVCRLLEREGMKSVAARERLKGMKDAYPWDPLIGQILGQLDRE
ncbi:MAG: hypothetical protein HYR85_20445 [Planctomycetes bacterium]|nr:hypothetical protein [Planctomycetota bacterium]MBI3845665.1 hypothetical protein [Planctomycetota bacterium]